MKNYKIRLVWISILLSALSTTVMADFDPSVCDPSTYGTYSGPKLPYLPNQISWRVELNIAGAGASGRRDYTMDFHQFVDYPNNKHAIHYWQNGQMYWTIFKYDTNEQVAITFPKDLNSKTESAKCTISPLDQSRFGQILGDVTINGKPHTADPLGILRLRKSNMMRYKGPVTLTSGVNAVAWEGCDYNPQSGYTTQTFWYFSNPITWYETVGKTSVPLLVSVVGSVPDTTNPGTMRLFNHRYSIADYRPYLLRGRVSTFQIPPGIYCKNDVNSKSLPAIPSHFTLRSEMVDGYTKTIGWTHEFYDNDFKLSRFDFKDKGSKYGSNELKRIHDFNSGVAYIIDKVTDQCWTSTIKLGDYDDRDLNSSHVRLRTPQEFFDFDRSNYSYVGQRIARGITCDVWTTLSYYWPPPGPNYYPTVWEYYFSADSRVAVGSVDEFNVPVMLSISQKIPPISKTFNFYEFDSSPTRFHDYDVSPCFNASGRADFIMMVDDKYKDVIFTNQVVFQGLLRISIQSAAIVSPVRVTNIGIDFNNTGLILTFTLLDRTGVKGNVDDPNQEPSLTDAIFNLKQAIQTNQFSVYVNNPKISDDYFTLVPKSYTYTTGATGAVKSRRRREVHAHVVKITKDGPASSGMSSGTLAGLAVGLMVAGIFLGFIIVLVVLRMRGQSSGSAQSFTNPMKEME